MAKKKPSAISQLFHTPVSLPVVGFFSLLGASLVVINLFVFLQQPKQSSTFSSISQTALQNVLGTTMSIGDPWPSPELNQSDPTIKYWQEIVQLRPDYRDAYIVLAILSFNKKQCGDTKFYLETARSIDPNSKILQEIIPKLSPCLEQ